MFSLCWRGGEAKGNSCAEDWVCSLSWGSALYNVSCTVFKGTVSVTLNLRKNTKLEPLKEKLHLEQFVLCNFPFSVT